MLFVSTLALLTAISSVVAAPHPQDIDFGAIIDDLPAITTITDIPLATVTATSITVNTASILSAIDSAASVAATSLAAESPAEDPASATDSASAESTSIASSNNDSAYIQSRSACAATSPGYGPYVGPADTDFLNSPLLATAAMIAQTPAGYTQTFQNLHGEANAHSWYALMTLRAYDAQSCANYCDANVHCLGFNILFERDPSLQPGPNCPNPPPTTQIKCVLHSYAPHASDATNTGQYQDNFHVVVSGSNGYAKRYGVPPQEAGYTASVISDNAGPTDGTCFINAPLDVANGNIDTFIRSYTPATNGPYDPSICTAACTATTSYDSMHPDSTTGLYDTCNFVVAGYLNGNTMTCALYTKDWSQSYASVTRNCPAGGVLSFTYGYARNPEQRTDVASPA